MSSSFLTASSYRASDVELLQVIHRTVLVDDVEQPTWRIEHRPNVGRTLVAATFLRADTIVFRERPLIAARATNYGDKCLRGGVPAVALALMQQPPDGPAKLLQQPRRTPSESQNYRLN